ncbi:MAG: hypothetical protein KC736_03310 [Candidatus Moranbacteria bacterium]|nr:hypothetical protein [Candidatus Moranbacteria bacterium]
MKKQDVEFWRLRGNREREYIVAHGYWQRQRGRNPSLPYKGEKNPKKALKMALKESVCYEALVGDTLERTVRHMLRVAKLTQGWCHRL